MVDDRRLKKIVEINEVNTECKKVLERSITRIKAVITVLNEKPRPWNTNHYEDVKNYQHAVRILESRKRMIDRVFLAEYGGDDKMTAAAKTELSLAKQDDGTLFKLGTYYHQQGRLFCKACDVEDDGNGNPIFLARLCPKCKRGVQHVLTSLAASDSASLGVESATESMMCRVFTCDNCQYADKYPIQQVRVMQDKPSLYPTTTIDLRNKTKRITGP